MNKNGFTLTELLVVIAIIGVLSVIVIPSIITVNKNINERLYTQKVSHIESAAELYASNNEEIFNGTDEVILHVYQLVQSNYMTSDVDYGSSNCASVNESKIANIGCVINPMNKTSMNDDIVILRKQNVGVVAKFQGTNSGSTTVIDKTLVSVVCSGFADNKYVGKYDETESTCKCNIDGSGNVTLVDSNTGNEVNVCLISGGNVVNNYLRYGSSDKPNWRVLGLYKINGYGVSAKIITDEPI